MSSACLPLHPTVAYLYLVRCMKAFAAMLLILGVTSVHAHKVTGAEIIEYGILKKIKAEGLLDAPNSLSGKTNNVIVSQLVQSTITIKASIGTTFGMLVKLLGEPEGAIVTPHFRCTHPRLTDPTSGRTGHTDDWESLRPIGTPRYVKTTRLIATGSSFPASGRFKCCPMERFSQKRHLMSSHRDTANQSMKPPASFSKKFRVFATTPCRGLSLSR